MLELSATVVDNVSHYPLTYSAIIEQFKCDHINFQQLILTIIQMPMNCRNCPAVQYILIVSDLILRSKVMSALTFCRRSSNTGGLFVKEHCVHHTKQVFSQLPHAACPLGTNFSIIQHSKHFSWYKIEEAFAM